MDFNTLNAENEVYDSCYNSIINTAFRDDILYSNTETPIFCFLLHASSMLAPSINYSVSCNTKQNP